MHRRPTRDGRPLAQKWDEENCDPELLLRRIGKELRENNQNLSGASESVSFAAEKQSHRPFETACGLLQVLSPGGEKAPLVARPLSWGWGGVRKHLPIQFQSALLLLQSADKSID